jgi:hypothetical protein
VLQFVKLFEIFQLYVLFIVTISNGILSRNLPIIYFVHCHHMIDFRLRCSTLLTIFVATSLNIFQFKDINFKLYCHVICICS